MAIILIRTIILFVLILLLMRLLGKRQLGEMELSELVVSVLLADLAAIPLQDISIPLMNGIIPILTLFVCELMISDLTLKSIWVRKLMCGKPSMLIKDGKIIESQMRKCRFTVDELTEELRGKDINDISKVQFAVLETDGTLNTILWPEERPATAAQLGVKPVNDGYAVVVIEEGKLIEDNLSLVGRNASWLHKELRRRGVEDVREVYAMIVFATGKIYFQKKDKENA